MSPTEQMAEIESRVAQLKIQIHSSTMSDEQRAELQGEIDYLNSLHSAMETIHVTLPDLMSQPIINRRASQVIQ